MNKTWPRTASCVLLLAALTACGGGDGGAPPSGAIPAPTPTPTPTSPPLVPPSAQKDCTDATCPELTVAGDSYDMANGARSAFSGYADPSLTSDAAGTLWMAYSWPHLRDTVGGGQVAAIDTHLARSSDGGESWQFEQTLWATTAGRFSHPDGELGGVDLFETPSIHYAASVTGPARWFGARWAYFVGQNGRAGSSLRVQLLAASTPAGLATAPVVTLGSRDLNAQYPAEVKLHQLAAEVSDCQFWGEPGLYSQSGRLYVQLRCLRIGQTGLSIPTSNLYLFSADPARLSDQSSWQFHGKLAGADEGALFGGTGVNQGDIVELRDGKLGLIASPQFDSSGNSDLSNSKGCAIFEIGSLQSGRLARRADGRPVVRAFISSLALEPLGPGACAYHPSLSSGILQVKRVAPPGGGLQASIRRTGIHP